MQHGPTPKDFLRRPEWIAGILITAAAAALHLYFWLHIGGLWRDEVNSVNIAGHHSFAAFAEDSFPALMPSLLCGWLALGLGGSDLSLRLPGLLAGLGILAVLWISSAKIRRTPPLLGLVLFGLNSTVIFFGDSIRAYGLGSLLAAAMTASAFVFLKQPSWPRAVWLTLFAILGVQTLYHNAILVAAICIGAWAVCWRRKSLLTAVQIFITAALSAASLLPYARNLIFNGGSAVVLRTGVKLPHFFASYGDTLGFPLAGYIYVWALLLAAIIVPACAGFRLKGGTPETGGDCSNDLTLFAAVVLTLAAAGFPVFFWRAQMSMQSWYVLPLMAFAVVCFDAVLPVLRGTLRAAFFGFVAATALISILTTGGLLNCHFTNVNLWARQLQADAAPEDYIVVLPWYCGISFDHYFNGATPWNTLPPLSDHSTHRYDLVKLQLEDTNAVAPVLRQIAATLQSGHRVWILADAGWMGVPESSAPAPRPLPPAPLKNTGWSDAPYSMVWASQVAHFTAGHSREFEKVKAPFTGRFIAENMELFIAGDGKDFESKANGPLGAAQVAPSWWGESLSSSN